MIEIGRMCVKLVGRDAGRKGVIIEVLDNNFVMLDGQVRRRKCNIDHIEPLDKVIKIAKNAPHEDIIAEFKKLDIIVLETKPKQKGEKPVRVKKVKTPKETVETKPAKEKAEKKAKAVAEVKTTETTKEEEPEVKKPKAEVKEPKTPKRVAKKVVKE